MGDDTTSTFHSYGVNHSAEFESDGVLSRACSAVPLLVDAKTLQREESGY